MTENFSLEATKRDIIGKQVKQLRRDGITPIVVYGPDYDAVALQADSRALHDVLRFAGGTQVIELKAGKETLPVLAHRVQRHPISRDILHVDFYRVDMNKPIRTEISIQFVGVSPAVHNNEAILMSLLNAIEIEALPGDLPQHIEVDITPLDEVGKVILVGDLDLGPKITIITSGEEPIVKADFIPTISDEEEAAEGSFFAEEVEVEVIKERKQAEEEE